MRVTTALGLTAVGILAIATVSGRTGSTPVPVPTATVTVAAPTPTPTVVVDGPLWIPVTAEFADALSEGDDSPPENAATRDWQACLFAFPGTYYVVVCPDGYVTTG